MNSRFLNHASERGAERAQVSARAEDDKKTTAKKSSGRGTRQVAKKTKKAKKVKKATSGSTTKKKVAKKKPSAKKPSAKKPSAKKTVTKKTPAKKAPVVVVPKSPSKRRNPRLVQNLLALRAGERELHFEGIGEEELIKLFEDSYPSELVNIFLGLKPSTCRRNFEMAIKRRKKAYLDVITLYYHRSYLANPFPLDLRAIDGGQLPNYYAILGVSKDATEDEIEVAAKLLLKAYQSESFPPGDRKLGDQRREEIKDSFSHLKTTDSRQVADRRLPSINYYYPRRDQSWMELMQRFIP